MTQRIVAPRGQLIPGITLQSVVIPSTNAQLSPRVYAYTGDVIIVGSLMQYAGYRASTPKMQFMVDANPLTSAVVKEFEAIPEVQCIYRNINDTRIYFYVFTSEKVYDDQLMDHLVGIELHLRGQYPDIRQSYEFVASVLVSDTRSITGANADLVFARKHG